MFKSGVYVIKNLVNGNIYVGSSTNYKHRWAGHKYDLRHNLNKSPLLQNDWNEYGEENFEFEVIVTAPVYLLKDIEQQLIDKFNPFYNVNPKAEPMFPTHWQEYRHTDGWKKEKSEQMKKLWETPEYRSKCSKPRKWKAGKPPNLGRKFSSEFKEKIRQANLGDKNPNYGRPRSQEFLDKVSGTYNGIVSPEGMVYNSVKNLRSFCREHNLDSGQMCRVINGKAKSHKGWTKDK